MEPKYYEYFWEYPNFPGQIICITVEGFCILGPCVQTCPYQGSVVHVQ